jgi:hypothetical protein
MKLNRKAACRLAIGLLLFPAAQALAMDRIFEINQDCVVVGCFEGDSPGFPVLITRPGRYRLTTDLVVPADLPETAIQVIQFPYEDRRAVDIDLNGFTVRGPFNCVGTPVASCNNGDNTAAGIVMQVRRGSLVNGTVRGFGGVGVNAVLAGEGLLADLIVTENAGGGLRLDNDSLNHGYVLRDSMIHRNGGNGFHTSSGSSRGAVLFVGNLFYGNQQIGAQVGTGSRLSNNTFVSNGQIAFTGIDGCLASATVQTGNGGNNAVLACSASSGTNFCDSVAC